MPDPRDESGKTLHIIWSDDGRHIRKWSHEPFEGSATFVAADELTALRSQVSELASASTALLAEIDSAWERRLIPAAAISGKAIRDAQDALVTLNSIRKDG